jgi:multidrug efflux system membrane fusion protein
VTRLPHSSNDRACQQLPGEGSSRAVGRSVLIIGAAAGLVALIAVMRFGASASPPPGRKDAPFTVEVTTAQVQAMPVLLQSVGQVVSGHSVTVRPEASGMLKRVFFAEGQFVSAGQRLFLIEPAPYEAALAATKAAAQSAAANADRFAALIERAYVTPQDYRNARAIADQTEAAYRQAQINLSHTDIRAPIAGRTGSLAVQAGNVLTAADAPQLVTINEMQPIDVQFSIPQQFLSRVREFNTQRPLKVSIASEDGARDLDTGALVFIDNTVNSSTGTVTLKARLPNAHEQLWPGQYVRVDLQLTVEPRAVVVPQTAIQTGQNGNYVYVVDDGIAEERRVSVDRQAGGLAVISEGVTGGERVVVRAPRNLRAGAAVIASGSAAAPAAAVTLPAT